MPRRRRALVLALLAPLGTTPMLAQRQASTGDSGRVAPRLTTTTILRGDFLRSLPIDDPRDALALYPGTVSRDDARGVLGRGDASLRGGAAGQASVYIDGAPARLALFGTDGMVPGLVAIEDLTITTGLTDATVADARGGVIAYTMRDGGRTVAGDFRAATDALFGDGSTVGYNTLEGWLGGPVPGAAGATWFVSGVAQGQESQYRSAAAAGVPLFVADGVDAVVTDSVAGGTITLPRYVQWSGTCGAVGNASTAMGRDIQNNYGAECHGLGQAMDWSSALRAHGKVTVPYGTGGSVSLTVLGARQQARRFPGELIGASSLYRGVRASSSLLVGNWRHPLGPTTRIQVTLSRGTDHSIAGPLASASEAATREPALGIEFGELRFEGEDILPVPVTDALVRNVHTNSGLRVPYPNRLDLTNAQPWRLNPYGLIDNGWYTQGLGATLTYGDERRLDGRGWVEFRPLAGHAVVVGADAGYGETSFYSSYMLAQVQFDAFLVRPRRWGVFGTDRFAVGPGTLEVGVRWDRFSSDARYPRTPGRVFTHPRAGLYLDAATNDSTYATYLADDSIWMAAEAQSAVSPRIRAAYPVGAGTALRASLGQHVETPSLNVLFHALNNDLEFTSVAASWGRDVRYAKVTTAELGVRHDAGGPLTIDAAVYRQAGLHAYGSRFSAFPDPASPSDTLFLAALQRVPGSTATGLDVLLGWRPASWLDVTLGYGFQRATQEIGDALTSHAVAGVVGLVVPDASLSGSLVSAVGRGVRGIVTFRFTSGQQYTPLANTGAGWTLEDRFGSGMVAGPINGSRLPWTKHLDLRIDKRWRIASLAGNVFLDVRNLLDFGNLVDIFTETGDTENPAHRAATIGDPVVGSREYALLRNEAADAGVLGGDGTTIDLRGNCQAWFTPVNCESLVRVENRFGDGDGLYTASEQERALNAYYDAFYGPWRFSEAGRTLRLGLQVGF